MLFVRPYWNLSGVDCPCGCGASRSPLTFLTCPSCSNVVLSCDDSQALYAPPREVASGEDFVTLAEPFGSADVLCPVCQSTTLSDYRPSTSEEVQALGFEPGEYE